jgi:hypothetical protein
MSGKDLYTTFLSSLTGKSSQLARDLYKGYSSTSCRATGTCAPPEDSVFNRVFGRDSSQRTTGASTGLLFFLSMALFIIFLILVFVNYTIYPVLSFSANDSALVSIPTASDRELAYTKDTAVPTLRRDKDTGLAKTVLPTCCIYTIGADLYINGGLKPISYPNVLLYRDLSGNSSPRET